jgi:hypothetical protein
MMAFQRPDGHPQAVAPLTIAARPERQALGELRRDFNDRSAVQMEAVVVDGATKSHCRRAASPSAVQSAAARGGSAGAAF